MSGAGLILVALAGLCWLFGYGIPAMILAAMAFMALLAAVLTAGVERNESRDDPARNSSSDDYYD